MKASTGNAFREYHREIIKSCLAVSPLLLGFIIMPHAKKRKTLLTIGTVSLALLLFSFICVLKQGAGTTVLPSALRIPGLIVARMVDKERVAYTYSTDRKPNIATSARHIILLIDESIRSDFFTRVVLPSLNSTASVWKIYDFGAATSMSNCSANSNIMLRHLVSAVKISEDLSHNPLVWSIAKNAGFSTYLLDIPCHGVGGNYFDANERQLIDHNEDVTKKQDIDLIDNLSRITSENKPTFTIVIKMGAHFPYSGRFPEKYHSKAIDTLGSYVQSNERKMRYVNAIDYQTGDFLRALLKTRPNGRTVVFYTSDHGQNVGDKPGGTHCTASTLPEVDEGIVPMLVLSNFEVDNMQAAAKRNKNQLSHFDMVATIKQFLGYRDSTNGDKGLLALKAPPNPGFVYGMPFGSFGSKIRVRSVDLIAYRELEKQRWGDVEKLDNTTNVATSMNSHLP